MDCSNVKPKLSAWLDQELTEGETRQVQEHVEQCPDCRKTLETLRGVGNKLGSLRAVPVGEIPAGLLAGLKGMPTWWVTLALSRRWLALGTGVAVLGVAGSILLNLSHPLIGTLTAATSSETRRLVPGTTLMVKSGQVVDLTLGAKGTPSSEAGSFQLQGPGALVVHRATESRFRRNQRLDLELPSGTLWIQFGNRAPPHLLNLTTPQALVRLTGTKVLVQATPAVTRVGVFEGKAEVVNLATREVRTVHSSQMVQIQAGWLSVTQIPVEEWLAGSGERFPEIPLSPKGSLEGSIEEETQTPAVSSEAPLWYEVK